jgi:hypothetical protein
MMSFITGSRAYGAPDADSDVDLVVLVTPADLEKLRGLADSDDHEKLKESSDAGPQGFAGSASLRFGRMNLLCVTDPVAFAVWARGTHLLRREADDGRRVTRELAIRFFEDLRRHHGLWEHEPTVREARDKLKVREEGDVEDMWEVGDSVQFTRGGVIFHGLITELDLKKRTCTVSHRGTDHADIRLADLSPTSFKRAMGLKTAKKGRPFRLGDVDDDGENPY